MKLFLIVLKKSVLVEGPYLENHFGFLFRWRKVLSVFISSVNSRLKVRQEKPSLFLLNFHKWQQELDCSKHLFLLSSKEKLSSNTVFSVCPFLVVNLSAKQRLNPLKDIKVSVVKNYHWDSNPITSFCLPSKTSSNTPVSIKKGGDIREVNFVNSFHKGFVNG